MGAIYLIRHGQASFASSDYDKLSSIGHEQGRILGAALRARKVTPDILVCGGMLRHRETAQQCLAGLGREASWDEDSGWNEYDHEAMLEAYDPRFTRKTNIAAEMLKSGMDPRRAFQELFSKAAARWVSGNFDDDYDESFSEFCARVEGALTRLSERLGKGGTALVFTSGGAISVVAKHLLGLPDDRTMPLSYTLANASVSKVIVGSSGVKLMSLNEHAHFEGIDPKFLTYR
jgi:broad specificity phosphatase PhoE